jgi:biotin operon repressor
VKDSARAVMVYLENAYPRYVSVPELIAGCRQSDIRKRVSELCAEGIPIEKERKGRFVNYRYAGRYQQMTLGMEKSA